MEAALVGYDWPGNVRELENLIRRVIALDESEFPLSRFEEMTGIRSITSASETETRSDMKTVVNRAEREAIVRALLSASGNKSHAARLLGLSRKTLYRRMGKHGIPL